MRGGASADGVGTSTPQLIPPTILRKNFEFIAKIKPHEVPNRPEFYMIGSGITEASLNALTIGAMCTHEDWRAPCFTTGEIAQAKSQLSAEQAAFDALHLTPEILAAHTAAGGLAVAAPPGYHFADKQELKTAFRSLMSNAYTTSYAGYEIPSFGCESEQYGDISKWDTSAVTDMTELFVILDGRSRHLTIKFNCDIGRWDTSAVTSMKSMFRKAENFNQNLGEWDTSKVTTMEGMFSMTNDFNGEIGTVRFSASPSFPFRNTHTLEAVVCSSPSLFSSAMLP